MSSPRIRTKGTDRESRAFEFFFYETGHELVDALKAVALHQMILQSSHVNETMKTAIIAIGSLGERLHINPLLNTDNERANDCHKYAQLQYWKGIQKLREQIEEDSCEDAAIFASLLFSVFEFLQGNDDGARRHIISGASIFRRKNMHSSDADPLTAETKRVFCVMINQAVLWMGLDAWPTPPLEPVDCIWDAVPPELKDLCHFNSLEEASTSQNYQFNALFNFRRLIALQGWTKPPYQVPPTITAKRQELLETLNRWPAGVQELCSRLGTANLFSIEMMQRIAVMHMNNLLTQIQLSVCLLPESKLTYDEFETQFRHIVALAKSVLRPADDTLKMRIHRIVLANNMDVGPHALFSFYAGLIAPLHFTAMKFNDLKVCREAVALLKEHPWREGAWDSIALAKIAERRLEGLSSKVSNRC